MIAGCVGLVTTSKRSEVEQRKDLADGVGGGLTEAEGDEKNTEPHPKCRRPGSLNGYNMEGGGRVH